jgi:hypothetical protein
MSVLGDDLSAAVVLFLGFGSASSPRQDQDSLARKFGSKKGDELASQVTALIHEMHGIPVDWSAHSLESAGNMVQEKMHVRYHDLSDSALRALTWKFTFDWR